MTSGECTCYSEGVAPLNFYSHSIDPSGVLDVLRRFGEVQCDGSGDSWTQAELSWTTSGGDRHSLTLGHRVEYYRGQDWNRQMRGMVGYFLNAEEGEALDQALPVLQSFQFSLSLPEQEFDLSLLDRDPRLTVVFAIAKHLDAVLFQPGALFDFSGRLLLNMEGERDPAAQLPRSAGEPGWFAALAEEDNQYKALPPDAQQVMRRALILTAVSARALTEKEAPDDLTQTREGIKRWIGALGVENELEPEEIEFLSKREVPGLQETIDGVWRIEGLSVLAWALGLSEMPGPDELSTPVELWKQFELFDVQEAQRLIQTAKLRPRKEIEAMNGALLAIHWRLRDFSIDPSAINLSEVVAKGGWFGQFNIEDLELADGDLAIDGVPISKADADSVEAAASSALERHLAINWLLDAQTPYSETDTST